MKKNAKIAAMFSPASALSVLIFLLLSACTVPKANRYGTLLDPLLGEATKEDVNRILKVSPVTCRAENSGETCEYRTAVGNNDPLPITHRQNASFGPDLSPLDYYDVILVTYDGLGVFKDWHNERPPLTTP